MVTHSVVPADFADEAAERLVHVDALLRRCLDESTPQVFCKVTALCEGESQKTVTTSSAVMAETCGTRAYAVRQGRTVHPDLTLILEVTFIGN